MSLEKLSSLDSLSHLRHELRTPINVIMGYSEMILEDLEIANDSTNLYNTQQIRECGIELIYLIKTLLNDEKLELYQSDLAILLKEETVQIKVQRPTNSIIKYCQQILNTTDNQDLVSDIKKINKAAQNLLAMTNDMSRDAIFRVSTEV
ncbi:MAG: histidine kinase dimerization/phospho-acceptor domain-containing protein [Xenococcus sp. (in: cyanobacteria)]